MTDWYANPNNPNERVKVTVTILDQDLRADALRVSASRQVSQGGAWVEAPVQAATVQKLEDIILTKARDLRRRRSRARIRPGLGCKSRGGALPVLTTCKVAARRFSHLTIFAEIPTRSSLSAGIRFQSGAFRLTGIP